jgi:hypothetical protein
MTWATVVFVSKRNTWLVAQEYDQWIVFELVDDEGSIQICDAIRGSWNVKGGGQKVFVKRTGCTVDIYIEGRFRSVRLAVQKAKQWSGDESSVSVR